MKWALLRPLRQPKKRSRVADRPQLSLYSIAAHRGFADALVAGLVPRYSEPDIGLARLTLLLPSSRAMRTVREAFIRLYGAQDQGGMLMPRMVAVGDLDLDEALGALLDPLTSAEIPPAIEPSFRWLKLAELVAQEMGKDAPGSAICLRLARDIAATMDRLLVEDIRPEDLMAEPVLDMVGDLAGHWQDSLRLFARVQLRWLDELAARGALDASARRNRLFDHAAARWKAAPPPTPVVAAGVTSASPALARLLKVIAQLPGSAVILPDFDLSLSDTVWDELGTAGATSAPGDTPLGSSDAVTHPQYHLKLLLNRMGVARSEVQHWHRKGLAAASPDRSHALSSLFLPPEASKSWVDLPADKRRLAGVRIMETANPEEEAQAIALLVRRALEEPEKRVAVITPDRGLARRVVQHLRRWNIDADDSAGRPLSQTAAGRVLLLLAEIAAEQAAPVPLVALLSHPLVRAGEGRRAWLSSLRAFERVLRGPRPGPGLAPLAAVAEKAQASEWWDEVSAILAPVFDDQARVGLSDMLDRLIAAGESLCGEALWSREDGRALSAFVEDLRLHAAALATQIEPQDAPAILRDAMEKIAVRPPYGGHPRVAIYGLLEARMARSDLVICGGLNEASWPAAPAMDALLAPPVLRALGVPGADFRIGLSAHDLAGALGAPEVVLSRAERDVSGPAIPSRFLLRVKALLGAELIDHFVEHDAPQWARAIDLGEPAPRYPKPQPLPSAAQRKQRISVTALDRLRSDPYQYYASSILNLAELDGLDAQPSPAWQGTLAHDILEKWHHTKRPMADIAAEVLVQMNSHPIMRSLWEPRLMRGLQWIEQTVAADADREPVLAEEWGEMQVNGVTIFGKIDRIDRFADGSLAIVDYKTGAPPSKQAVAAGYALQLGTLGLMAEEGAFKGLAGYATAFEYWSLGKSKDSDTGFGYVASPIKLGAARTGMELEEFLPKAEEYLHEALDRWIVGDEPFTARLNPDAKVYNTFDQLMRLDEWMGREE